MALAVTTRKSACQQLYLMLAKLSTEKGRRQWEQAFPIAHGKIPRNRTMANAIVLKPTTNQKNMEKLTDIENH